MLDNIFIGSVASLVVIEAFSDGSPILTSYKPRPTPVISPVSSSIPPPLSTPDEEADVDDICSKKRKTAGSSLYATSTPKAMAQ